MSAWSREEMLEIFGQVYEVMTQKSFEAACKSGRYDFGVCLFENVDLQGLCIADEKYNFSTCRFNDCRFVDCYLDGALFENTVFQDCEFKNVEALHASFGDARVFHSRFQDVVFHELDANGSTWRHGFMNHVLLGRADLNVKIMDDFSFHNVRAVQCSLPHMDAITMGGATETEVNAYRKSVLDALASSHDLALLDALGESKTRIYSAIYYLSPERVTELAENMGEETNEPDTQEWRDNLAWNEKHLVQRWDLEFEQGIQNIAEAFCAARSSSPSATVPQNSTVGCAQAGKLDAICRDAISRAAEINISSPKCKTPIQPERSE